MLETGEKAPDFTRPATVDGEIRSLSLSEYAGDDVVVLTFYPADFSPTCTDEPSQLPDLEAVRSVRDDFTAIDRYREAYDHYRYGRSELETAESLEPVADPNEISEALAD